MKQIKLIFLLAVLMSMAAIEAFCQATSLVIDNQTPGWLSSKINYGDQQTVEELKVTGYLNGTDFNFLVQLQLDYNLRVIDLTDVNIVKGGENVFISSYQDDTGNRHVNEAIITENNVLPSNLFLPFINTRKISTPKSVTNLKTGEMLVNADTVIINGQFKEATIYVSYYPYRWNYYNLPKYSMKSLELSEGLESVTLYAYHSTYSDQDWPNFNKLVLSSTITNISKLKIKKGNIVSFIENPTSVTFDDCRLYGDTIFVPAGTKSLYQSTLFNKMKVIVEMNAPDEISLDTSNLKLYRGETGILTASFMPEEVYYKELNWESSDVQVASVTQNGEVVGLLPGTANIVVSSVKNSEVQAQCVVKVYEHTTGIEISTTKENVNVGESIQLTAKTLPMSTSDNEITWSTDNDDVATVDEDGNVYAVSIGSCIIKATSVDGGYEAECEITVVQPANAVLINKHTTSIIVGKSETLTATVSPENTTNKGVEWTSNNNVVAEVDENGIVTAKKAGSAIITATAVSNGEAKDMCEVTVIQPVTGIALDESSYTMEQLGQMKQLVATVLPEDASDKSVEWTSSNTSVCSVSSNGTIIAVGYGTSTIVATTVDGGFPAACVVKVVEAPSGIDTTTINLDNDVIIYDVVGHRLNKLTKGINIIKMSDGTTKKVIVK